MTLRTFHYLLNSDLDTDPDAAFQVNPDPDQIWIQGFDDQNLKNKIEPNFLIYLFLIKKLQFTYP
jgi:hypothetical protein